MSPYRVALGHDNEASFADIAPQPAMPELPDYASLKAHADDFVYANGYLRAVLVWSELTAAQVATVLTQFGLSRSTRSALVTVRLRDDGDSTYSNWNATAVYPRSERRKPLSPFRTNLTIILNKLETT